MGPRLETARLTLTPIAATDLPPVVRVHTDPELMRHIHSGQPHSRSECEDDLGRALSSWERHGVGPFIARDRAGDLVGIVGIGYPEWCPEADGSPDVGWTIVQAHQRRGHATEAGTALLDWFFATGSGPRIVGIHNRDNPRSGTVMQRLGMRWRCQALHPEFGYPIELWEVQDWRWAAQRGRVPHPAGGLPPPQAPGMP